MAKVRKSYSSEFKAKVAIEAVKGERTMAELVREYGVRDNQIYKWRNHLLDQAAELFKHGGLGLDAQKDAKIDDLHRTIGQLVSERDFLKKVLDR